MFKPRFWPLAVITPDDVEDRMTICRSCDQFRSKIAQCKQCGCFMPLKVKVFQAQCPMGKW